jgi:hypothetical protein
MKVNLVVIILFLFYSNSVISMELINTNRKINISDTILVKEEISLKDVRFYFFEDLTKLENTFRDTVTVKINDTVYRIPYKISAQSIIDFQKQYQNYKLTGISLYANPELESYIKELFSNPRKKLNEKISAKDWTSSPTYLRYFEKYDQNSSNLSGKKIDTDNDDEEYEEDDVVENYDNFPLPETIDIIVDLKGNPKVVTILGLEFDFTKLDPKFQKLLLGYGGSINKNRKSNLK